MSYIQEHEKLAAKTFADFQIVSYSEGGGLRRWVVGCPGVFANRQFEVVTWPGNLVTCGDNGEMWWQRSGDMIGWARGSAHSIYYFAEKVARGFTLREYNQDEARRWVREQVAERRRDRLTSGCGGKADEAADATTAEELLYAADEGHRFAQAYHDSHWSTGADWPGRQWERYTNQFLWARSAVQKLIELLDQREGSNAGA